MASRKPVGMKTSKVKSLKNEKKSVTKSKTEVKAKKKAVSKSAKTAPTKAVGKKPLTKATMKTKHRTHAVPIKNVAGSGGHNGPEIGQHISDFTLPATMGDFSLSAHAGKYVVLYFYPRDATPGCTLEGHEFSRLQKDFEELGAQVYGISRDSMKSHERFKEKEGYSVDLLSDKDAEACGTFDVIKEKMMYGKPVVGIERSTFLVDPEGRLAAEWRKVSVPGHAEAVLEKLKEIQEE